MVPCRSCLAGALFFAEIQRFVSQLPGRGFELQKTKKNTSWLDKCHILILVHHFFWSCAYVVSFCDISSILYKTACWCIDAGQETWHQSLIQHMVRKRKGGTKSKDESLEKFQPFLFSLRRTNKCWYHKVSIWDLGIRHFQYGCFRSCSIICW